MPIYHGLLKIRTSSEQYVEIASLRDDYFEEHDEMPLWPYLHPGKDPLTIVFNIDQDYDCSQTLFQKEIHKILSIMERIGDFVIESGYINSFEIYGLEEPMEYKYTIRRKNDKLAVSKQSFHRSTFLQIRKYLKNSTPENAAFLESLETTKS